MFKYLSVHPDKVPKDLPFIQWKYVKISTAYNMYTSKQVGWERAKKGEYQDWCVRMEKLRKENL